MTGTEAGPPSMAPQTPTPAPPVTWEPAAPPQPGPAPGLRYGGFWARTVAYIIDATILAVIAGALSSLYGGPGLLNWDFRPGDARRGLSPRTGGSLGRVTEDEIAPSTP